ncbi:hypothetical protein STEG23_018393, partial [Scotinomys teguina]
MALLRKESLHRHLYRNMWEEFYKKKGRSDLDECPDKNLVWFSELLHSTCSIFGRERKGSGKAKSWVVMDAIEKLGMRTPVCKQTSVEQIPGYFTVKVNGQPAVDTGKRKDGDLSCSNSGDKREKRENRTMSKCYLQGSEIIVKQLHHREAHPKICNHNEFIISSGT